MSDNARKHGCTSEKLLLPDEDPAEYQALLDGLIENYRPETALHQRFVLEAARALWMLERKNRRYDEMEQALYVEQRDSTKWTAEQCKQLELRMRYRTTAERSCTRALKSLEHIRKSSAPEAKAEPKPAKTENKNESSLKPPSERPPIVHQRIITTETDGQRITEAFPTNEEILMIVKKIDRLGGVDRVFEYPEGRHTWRGVRMSIEEWVKQAEIEGEGAFSN